jgi:hypothetical protein
VPSAHSARRPDKPAASTIDAVDTAGGRLAAVLALVEQMQGRSGHYGDGPGAAAVLPPGP